MCVAELVAILLGWLLTTFTDLSTVDHDVEVVGEAVDADRTEGERLKAHAVLCVAGYTIPSAFAALRRSGALTQSIPL